MTDRESSEDRAKYYTDLGEAYQIAPWRIASELTIPQMYGLYCSEGQPKTIAEAVERARRIKEKNNGGSR